MKIKELIDEINKNKIKDIEIEDYKGNTICFLKDLDIADVELCVLRLQINTEDLDY